MPVLNQHVDHNTPMGATLAHGGATFRTWAPCASDVYVVTDDLPASSAPGWTPKAADRLHQLGDQTWAGFVPSLADGAEYLFWIRGQEDAGFKRDPYARELGTRPRFPDCPCLVRDPGTYPWHDRGWRPPDFRDLIIYELHVGTWWAVDDHGNDRRRAGVKFVDLLERIAYLRDLGVNAIELLPVQEFPSEFSMGYNGVDYFSPEMDFQLETRQELGRYVTTANALLTADGTPRPALQVDDLLPGPNQLKCLIDLCHLHGIAVLFDVVYNHAGGGFGERSLWFYDRQHRTDPNRSLYFTDRGWAGGNVFAYWQAPVRQFLIDNARFLLQEYHLDGFRYDEVSVASNHGGDQFCRDLTSTVRTERPEAIQIAEYWNWDRARAVTRPPAGLGFDAAWSDRLRDALRAAVRQASGGADAYVDLDRVREALYTPNAFPSAWTAVNFIEDHDTVRWDYEAGAPKDLRIPALADFNNRRSWFAASRSRVATTLLLTAPGIPMLFMGQEILEDKPWHDDVANWSRFLIWWDGLGSDQVVQDFRRFVRDLVWLRRGRPALRGEGIRVPQVHNVDRVLVVHRWVEGGGRDVVVVASLNESTLTNYSVDLPFPGRWYEVFNSDYYDHFPNAWVAGNGGHVQADERGRHLYPYAAHVRIPANGALVLAREP
jgi:1,4-alpha-glucan branching enzyme